MYAKKYVYIKAFSHRAVHIYFFYNIKKSCVYAGGLPGSYLPGIFLNYRDCIREHT
jgi:hypothetical protein